MVVQMTNIKNKEFVERNVKNLKRINKMNEGIRESGGLFYQYRPCRRDENTIYDIENITHGVVYARSPLFMNDPFDSEIGFSTEKVIDDILDMFLADFKGEESVKNLLRFIIKNRLLGTFTDLVKGLNELKKELNILLPDDLTQQQRNSLRRNLDKAIKRLPKNIQKLFHKKNINNILFLILQIKELEITEQSIYDLVLMKEELDRAIEEINKIKETVFEGKYKKFLSTINISCFTASGWNNALMWAHYANSYAGICIEYDFNKLKNFVGFIYPVDYLHQRPVLSIKDLGSIKEGKFEPSEMTDEATWQIINYMLVKDKVWDYEKEWRIIDPQDSPNTPSFIPLPYIKSITMGTKIDPLIKNWIINICNDKDIDCYELILSYDSFGIDRVPVDVKNYTYNIEEDSKFLTHLSERTTEQCEKLNPMVAKINDNNENGKFDYELILKALSAYEDILISSYFAKNVIKRMLFSNKELLLCYGEALKEMVKKISDSLLQKDVFVDLKDRTWSFVLAGTIDIKQKKVLDKKLEDVLNVMTYYSEHEWDIDG